MASLSASLYDQLVEEIYRAALGESEWAVPLSTIARATGSLEAVFQIWKFEPEGSRILLNASIALPIDDLTSYAAVYAAQDPRAEFALRMGARVPAAFTDLDFTSERDMRMHAYYEDFLRPLGFRYAVCAPCVPAFHGGGTGALSLQRGPREGVGGQDEKDLLLRLIPHIRRAMEIEQLKSAFGAQQDYLRALLDSSAYPTWLVDARGRVDLMNTPAEKLAHGAISRVRGGRLVMVDESDQLRFLSLLRSCQPGGLAPTAPRGGYLRASGASGMHIFEVTPTAVDQTLVSRGCALVRLRFPMPAYPDDALAMLRDCFDLTASELRVMRELQDGLSLREIAERSSISYETVRTQLKAAMRKTGVRSQKELIGLLASMV